MSTSDDISKSARKGKTKKNSKNLLQRVTGVNETRRTAIATAEAERARRMGSTPQVKPRALLVDLDGTLYRSAKLFDDVRERINGE